MRNGDFISMKIPSSLLESLERVAKYQEISPIEGCRRVIRGIFGLSVADLRSLPEPPRPIRERVLILDLDSRHLDVLSEVSKRSRLSGPSILRRILYGMLITHKVRFVCGESENDLWLGITKYQFQSSEDWDGEDAFLC
jgi:hypothetical protein